MSSLNWPFRVSVDPDGTHHVCPLGIPNCEGIGADIDAAKRAARTALSFVFDNGIAPVPAFAPDFAVDPEDLKRGKVTQIRIDLSA